MKVWVVTQEWDGEVTIDAVNSQEAADRIAYEAQNIDWANSGLTDRPKTWDETYERLLEEDAVENWIKVECFDVFPPDNSDDPYVQAAMRRQRDGELEIDSNAIVSKGDDNGAYVQAWVWVYDDEVIK